MVARSTVTFSLSISNEPRIRWMHLTASVTSGNEVGGSLIVDVSNFPNLISSFRYVKKKILLVSPNLLRFYSIPFLRVRFKLFLCKNVQFESESFFSRMKKL